MGPWSPPLPRLLTSTSWHLPVQQFLPVLREWLPALPMPESRGCLYRELDLATVELCVARQERPLCHASMRTDSQSCWGRHTGLGVWGLWPHWLRAVLGLLQPLSPTLLPS